VAGTSIEIALSCYATSNDILAPFNSVPCEIERQRVSNKTPQNYEYSWRHTAALRMTYVCYRRYVHNEKPIKFYNHINLADIKRRLGSELFNSAARVSIVRHPLDVLISLFRWAHRGERSLPNFSDWLLMNRRYWALNNEYYLINGEEMISHWIKYENIQDGLEFLEQEFPTLEGLQSIFSGVAAKRSAKSDSSRADYFGSIPSIEEEILTANEHILNRFYK